MSWALGHDTTTSWHTWLPFVFDIQPLETIELRTQALARLGAVPTFIDNEIDNLREGLRLGYSAPRVTVKAVPDQVRSLISPDSIFLGPAARSDDPDFQSAVAQIYNEEITPALNRFADFIDNEYLAEARETLAVLGNPNGEACYPTLVRSFVTVAVPAAEIHAVGLEQVAKIHEEIQVTLDEYFGGGDVSEFLRRVNEAPAFTFDPEPAGLKSSSDALDAVKPMPRAAACQGRRAGQTLPRVCREWFGRVPLVVEDGTRPGIFYIAVTDPTGRSRSNQLATAPRDLPGHHLQGAIALNWAISSTCWRATCGTRATARAGRFIQSGWPTNWALPHAADRIGRY